jgi:hypothetical protein
MIARLLLAVPAAALLGAAPLPAPQGQGEPEAVESGEPVNCIPVRRIRNTRVRSDRVIDFQVSNREFYRNELPHDCPGLGFERRISYQVRTSSLCSVDTVTVLESSLQRGATCGLGTFQPMKTVAAK